MSNGQLAMGDEQWAIIKIYVMRDFHTLKIWQRSHQLTLDVYEATRLFPSEELFGLTSQLRRAVASIPTNIAEGCGRASNKDFAHFLQISIGSLSEVEYELLLANSLNYIEENNYRLLSDETVAVRKMIINYRHELIAHNS
jgi:four helix bundle protein